MSTEHQTEMNLIKRILEEKCLKQTWLSGRLGKNYDIVNILKLDPKELINSNKNN